MVLIKGAMGERVTALQQALKDKGFDPGEIDGDFGAATEAAVLAFQKSSQLLSDGKAGAKTLAALGLKVLNEDKRIDATPQFTVAVVAAMFPSTPLGNIKANLPLVLSALQKFNLGDREMILMALATIRVETEGFVPISEFISRFNTPPGGTPFSLYDNRRDLGNKGRFDGQAFKGRGFIQLTGRDNYERIGAQIDADLVNNPEKANDPNLAATILAQFLENQEQGVRNALIRNDLEEARRLVNGGSHGVLPFKDAFKIGKKLTA
jgi:putative chitinase